MIQKHTEWDTPAYRLISHVEPCLNRKCNQVLRAVNPAYCQGVLEDADQVFFICSRLSSSRQILENVNNSIHPELNKKITAIITSQKLHDRQPTYLSA